MTFEQEYKPPITNEILYQECVIQALKAGGPGGQHANKSETGVRLIHYPTGITVISRTERSRNLNIKKALEQLRMKIEVKYAKKTPRIATKVPQRAKRRRVNNKMRQGQKKEQRRDFSEEF